MSKVMYVFKGKNFETYEEVLSEIAEHRYEYFDQMINETNQNIKINELSYSASEVLKSVDQTAYRVGVADYESTLEDEIKEIITENKKG